MTALWANGPGHACLEVSSFSTCPPTGDRALRARRVESQPRWYGVWRRERREGEHWLGAFQCHADNPTNRQPCSANRHGHGWHQATRVESNGERHTSLRAELPSRTLDLARPPDAEVGLSGGCRARTWRVPGRVHDLTDLNKLGPPNLVASEPGQTAKWSLAPKPIFPQDKIDMK